MLYSWYSLFKDAKGADVRVNIYYKDYGATTPTVFTFIPSGSDPLKLRYFTADENDLFAPILYSECVLKVYLQDNEGSQQLMNTLNTCLDGEYIMTVNIFNGSDTTTWYGTIAPDQVKRDISYSGEVEIKAICPLTFTKNQRLANTDGRKFIGNFTLLEYCEAIVTNSIADYGTTPGIDFSINIHHDLTLSNQTVYDPSLPYPDHTYFPNILDQMKVDAVVFGDSDGRSKIAHDVLEYICRSFGIRLQFKNGVFDFQEILKVHDTEYYEVGTKDHDSEIEVNDILLQNAENISRIRMYREAYVNMTYSFSYGLLMNSQTADWSTGFYPDNIAFNFTLADYSERRRGNGREENPYGIMLRSYGKEIIVGGTPTGYDQMNYMELMAFKTPDRGVLSGQLITVKVKASIEGTIGELYTNDGRGNWDNDITRYTYMICDAVIYNSDNPESSYRLTRDFGSHVNHPEWQSDPFWEEVDLSNNLAFSGGGYDFNLNYRIPELLSNESMISNPELVMRYQFRHGQPIPFKSLRYNIQESTVSLPVAPANGRLYICVSQIMNPGRIIYSKGIVDCFDTVVRSVVLSVGSEKKINQEVTGESVYLSRNIKSAKIKQDKDIYMNTSADGTVSGSLYTDIAYHPAARPGSLTPAGLVQHLNHNSYGTYLGDTSLLKYNAFAMQAYNTGQQLVYCKTRAANPSFKYYGVRFSALVDDTHYESTYLYGYYHLIQRLEYDVKNCISDITAISMKIDPRNISTTTLNDTTDLLEEYNKQS